jgi:O-acetyl-ADP-ribose deacetylase (regulator of RNase III)
VGPVWQGGGAGEADLLAGCYREAIRLASKHQLASLAFPAISTGIYGYPKAQAARIAVTTVRQYLPQAPSLTRVVFCCFDDETASHYKDILTPGASVQE